MATRIPPITVPGWTPAEHFPAFSGVLTAEPWVDFYVQPGGCLELGESNPDEPGSHEVVHVCVKNLGALEALVKAWREALTVSGDILGNDTGH